MRDCEVELINILSGLIVRSLSGFYDVLYQNTLYSCRGRGLLRKQRVTPVVGDKVEFTLNADGKTGTIGQIFERENLLVRPPIANVDQVILVFSVTEPDFNLLLLDRFLVCIENKQLRPLICLTKVDLLSEEQLKTIENYKQIYRQIGYEVGLLSTRSLQGVDWLRSKISGKINVLAGQSGVGKSSLLNALDKDLLLPTNNISRHLGRGKHTTRHVEFIRYEDSFVADTPGFSSLELTEIAEDELMLCFPEFADYQYLCKFRGCLHINEPDCRVQLAVTNNEIALHRYANYRKLFLEIKDTKRRY